MKHTQIIELLSNIKATFMSFFSIMMFVALSVAIFCGISWTGPALQTAANQIFEEGKLHDFEITYPYGLTEENYEELLAMDDIDEVEGGYLSFQTVQVSGRAADGDADQEAEAGKDENDADGEAADEAAAAGEGGQVMKVMSLTETIDTAINVEGRLPEKKGEIAISATWAAEEDIRIGDVIAFDHDADEKDADGMKNMKEDTYTVTAIMDSPAYISVRKWSYGVSTLGSGTIDCLGWVTTENFDTSKFPGYVQTYIRCDALRNEKPFSKKYDEVAEDLNLYLTGVGEDISEARFLEIKSKAQAEVDKAAKKLEKAEKQIEKGKGEIAKGEQKLIEGRAELAAGWKKLQDGLAKLQAGQAEYDAMKPLYDEVVKLRDLLGEAIQKAEEAGGILDPTKLFKLEELGISEELILNILGKVESLLEYLGLDRLLEKVKAFEEKIKIGYTLPELEDLYNALTNALPEAEQLLRDGLAKLTAGWKEYEDGLATYEAGQQEIAAGEAQLAQKKLELEAGIKEYEDGLAKLEEGQKEVDALKKYGWTILSRNGNGGVQAIQRFSGVTDNLRYSMAMLFIIIGLLVSYSSISRIVKDQIVSLGTKKALGVRSREITLSYLAYSGTAVFTGAVIGFLLGTFGIERIIAVRLGERFIMGTYASQFVPGQALLLFVIEMVLILLTTWFACRSILKMQAVELLKGPKPPAGKERFFEKWRAWENLSLLNKTIVNNCFNDKKRVLGTIIGVAGCTALMVTAVTMNDNIQKSFTKQYEDVYHFDTIVRYNALRDGLQQQVDEKLGELGVSGTPVRTESFGMDLPDGKKSFVQMTVPFDDDSFDVLYPAGSDKARGDHTYGDGIWLNDAYERHFDAKAGDPVSITDGSGESHTFTIEGFFDHHLISYEMIMEEDVYEQAFGTACEANAFLVDSGELEPADVRQALDGMQGILFVRNDYTSNEATFLEFSQVSGIVIAIYLVLATLMAIVVLLDLNIVCIEEKKRELIVLMINGFSIKDARRYIYRDTIALTAIGIVCGVIFGSIMGNITVMSVEPNEASFVMGIDWMACLIGAASSAVLSYIMSKIALRRIAGFSLTDINKM